MLHSAYSIKVAYKRIKDIVTNDAEVNLVSIEGKTTKGTEEKEVLFNLPSDSEIVSIYFANVYPGTKVTYHQAKVVDAATGDIVKNIKLKYKYIPDP